VSKQTAVDHDVGNGQIKEVCKGIKWKEGAKKKRGIAAPIIKSE
jgi:hypothetical protein